MALAYLLSPTFQIENTAGKPATGGYIEVYVAGSRNKYYCASDFDGTLHPFRIPLDSLGSNIVLADDAGTYDVYVYNRYGSLMMSRYNVKAGSGGGISGNSISSSDGSIVVTPTADGVDLKVDAKPPTVMRCTASGLTGDGQFQFSELQRDGQGATVDASGRIMLSEGWWHYDATARLRWAGNPGENGTQSVAIYTANGSDSMTFDLSYAHSETVQINGEFKAASDGTQFVLGMGGIPAGLTVELVDFGIHSIVGEGAGGKYNAGEGIVIDETSRVISIDPDTVQGKLTPGTGISIDEEGVISVDESAVQEIFPVTYGSTTFQEIRAALIAGKLPVLFLGDATVVGITVQRIPIYDFFYVAGSPGNSYAQFWSPYVYKSSSTAFPPYALFSAYSASYDFATHKTTWSTSYKYFAEQSDWAESDATKLTFIKNKPSIPTKTSDLANDSGFITSADLPTVDQVYDASSTNAQSGTAVAEAIAAADNTFIAVYGVTAIGEVDTAYSHGKDIICRYNDGRGHVYSSQLASLVSGMYTFSTTEWFTDYEFKLSPNGGTGDWSISSRAIPSGTQLVPTATQSDAGEVLTVDQNGVPEWAPAQAPISAGNGVDITNNVVSAKVDGTSVTFNANGELEATAAPQVQSDWAESDPADVSFIRNKPGQTSLVAGANITIVDDAQNNTVTISASATQAPVQGVTVDNVSVVNAQGVAEIPSIPAIGTITL